MTTDDLTTARLDVPTSELEQIHLRKIYRAEYAHLLHDVDPDSDVPAIVVSLTKPPRTVSL